MEPLEFDVLINIERLLTRVIELLEEDTKLLRQLTRDEQPTFIQGTGVTFKAS
jgi:hypothetical protein